MKIAPTIIENPFDTDPSVEIRLFGRNGGTTDWSIAALTADAAREPTGASVRTFDMLRSIAAEAKIHEIYAPRPSFNAHVCRHHDLRATFETNHDAIAEAEFPENWPLAVYRGADADGCDVPKGSAFWVSSADCPTLIVTDGLQVICAHCGYLSLVDIPLIRTGVPSRKYYSVVDAALARFARVGPTPRRLTAYVILGISDHFKEIAPRDMRLIEEYEKKIAGHDKACLPFTVGGGQPLPSVMRLVEAQLLNRERGALVLVGKTDSYADKDADGKLLWWSHQRAVDCNEQDDLRKRNGVLVINRN